MRRGILAIPALLMMVATAAALTMPAPRSAKTYREMSSEARTSFVLERARRVCSDLRGDGQPMDVSPELVAAIQTQLDSFVADRRVGDRAASSILARGVTYAPVINPAFRAAKLPTSLGIALAMSESEFAECAVSGAGSRGMFQFMPKTGERYGLDAEGLCNVERSAVAAAAYHNNLRSQFTGKAAGMLVSVLAYNTGERAAEATFGEISRRDDAAATTEFWRIVFSGTDEAGRSVLVPESQGYLPRLIACAIMSETPGAFGVKSGPLSGL